MTFYVNVEEELDDDVLMGEHLSGEIGNESFYYDVDYEDPEAFTSHNFLWVLRLGMRLAKEGYDNVEIARVSHN